MVKNLPAIAGDAGLIPGSGRSPGVGHGNPLQCFHLENPMNRGDWWSTVRGVAKSQTSLSVRTHTHQCSHSHCQLAGHSLDLELPWWLRR